MKSIIILTSVVLSTAAMANPYQGSCGKALECKHAQQKDQDQGMDQGQQADQEQGVDQGQQTDQDQGIDQGQQTDQDQSIDQGQQTDQDGTAGQDQYSQLQEYGPYRVSKYLQSPISINVNQGHVNTVYLQSTDAKAQISSAQAYLSNGQIVDIEQFNNRQIIEGEKVQGQLAYNRQARVEKIVVKASSYHLIGPAARIGIVLGFSQH